MQYINIDIKQSRPKECDVIIPFHNSFDLARKALKSILGQQEVTCFIHMVDDVSTMDTSMFEAECKQYPNVSYSQNKTRCGPYRSLHNIFHKIRSDFIAIQDADDLSLPDRIYKSICSLENNHADIFAAAVRIFRYSPDNQEEILYSLIPDKKIAIWESGKPLVNGAMVMRKEIFHRLNGFADFFCGADREFILRAYYANARFNVSNEILVLVRRDGNSLTETHETGFSRLGAGDIGEYNWVSSYRQNVWKEIKRRLKLFQHEDWRANPRQCDFSTFGCLDPKRSKTIGDIEEPRFVKLPWP